MGKITFVLGGARSGKSAYSLKLAKKYKKVAFVATCLHLDKEMKKRIELHKKSRPSYWRTFESTQGISSLLEEIGSKFEVIIIDCLTLWVSGLLFSGLMEDAIEEEIIKTLSVLKKIKGSSIIVSNEVGLGIVPRNKLARRFRDIAGRINQLVAAKSNNVFFMISGLPLKIK